MTVLSAVTGFLYRLPVPGPKGSIAPARSKTALSSGGFGKASLRESCQDDDGYRIFFGSYRARPFQLIDVSCQALAPTCKRGFSRIS